MKNYLAGLLCVALALGLVACKVPKEKRVQVLKEVFAQLRTADPSARAAILKKLQGQRPQTREEVLLIARELDGPLYPIAQEMIKKIEDPKLLPEVLEIGKDRITQIKNWNYEDFKAMTKEQQIEAHRKQGNVESVIFALGNMEDPKAIPFLKECLDYEAFSYLASSVLGKIGDEAVLGDLMQRIDKDRNINVSSFGDKALLRVAKELDDPNTMPARRGGLIEQIKGSAKPQVHAVLKDLALNNKDPEVRQRAGLALVNSLMLNRAAADEGFIAAWTQDLINKNDYEDVETYWAICAMGVKWDSRYVPILLQILRTSHDPAARGNAAYLLGQKKIEESVPELEKALLDKDSGVRSCVWGALKSILGQDLFMKKYNEKYSKNLHPDDVKKIELIEKNKEK